MVQTVVGAGDSGAQELVWFREWQQQGIQELRKWDGSDSGSSRRLRSSGIRMIQRVVAAGDSGAQELGWLREWQHQGIQELRNWDGSDIDSSRGFKRSGIRDG